MGSKNEEFKPEAELKQYIDENHNEADEKIGITEGQIKEIPKDRKFYYPGIDSCLIITLFLEDGTRVACHLVMSGGQNIEYKPQDAFVKMQELAGDRTVKKIYIAAGTNEWSMDLKQEKILDFDAMQTTEHKLRGLDFVANTCQKKFQCDIKDIKINRKNQKGDYYVDLSSDGKIVCSVEPAKLKSKL